MTKHSIDGWAVTAAAAALMAITMGSRSSFGLFVSPLNTSTALGLATISFAGAVSQLAWGAAQPLLGAAAERFGTARVVAYGGVASAAATLTVTAVDSATGLVVALALAAVAAAAMGSNALLLAEVNRRAPAHRRGLAAGIVSAGGSAGQLILVLPTQAMIAAAGWIFAMAALAALALLALPLSRAFRSHPAPESGPLPVAQGTPAGVREALLCAKFWMVAGGFFVCGFHVSFLLAHMPGQIDMCGLPASLSGQWIALVGACNVVGGLTAGAAIGRISPLRLLVALYAARALGVTLFLAAPKTAASFLGFAVWMGLTYMATVPPTSAAIDRLFGSGRLATLLGVVMLVHQIGAFLGVWLGGVVLEVAGAYDWVWYADAALAATAAAIHLPLCTRARTWRASANFRAVCAQPLGSRS
jgi:MFS family permease